jgi:uncharacterized membrane protein YoaK (UPF0700 family)
MIVSGWTIFTKANKPGWASLIPIYNILIGLEIVDRPWWWLLLLLIPVANLVFAVILCIDLAKAFGQGAAFGIGLLLLGFIFYPILAFGDAQYLGAATR